MSYVPIDDLTNAGVSATDLKKLKEAGFNTVRSLLMVPKKDLVAVKGFSDAKVDKVLDAAIKLLPKDSVGGFLSAAEWMQKRKDTIRITSGAECINAILGGGFETRAITEV